MPVNVLISKAGQEQRRRMSLVGRKYKVLGNDGHPLGKGSLRV